MKYVANFMKHAMPRMINLCHLFFMSKYSSSEPVLSGSPERGSNTEKFALVLSLVEISGGVTAMLSYISPYLFKKGEPRVLFMYSGLLSIICLLN